MSLVPVKVPVNGYHWKRFSLSSCEIGAGRQRDQSGPAENAPSDFSNAARRSVTSAIGEARFFESVSAGAQIFPALQRQKYREIASISWLVSVELVNDI
jgi:hypothetical protein